MSDRNTPDSPMAGFKEIAERIMANLPEPTSLQDTITQSLMVLPKLPTGTIERYRPRTGSEKAKLLGNVLAKFRMALGWQPISEADQLAMVAVWMEVLDTMYIPADAYNELYLEAMAWRADSYNSGESMPTFGADLFLSLWPKMRSTRAREFLQSLPLMPRDETVHSSWQDCAYCRWKGWVLDPKLGAIICSHLCPDCEGRGYLTTDNTRPSNRCDHAPLRERERLA